MGRFLKSAGIAFIVLVTLIPLQLALADTGPKPTMDFKFIQEFNGPSVTITSGILLECKQPDCSDAAPLKQLGPQGFSCQALSCSALAYGFSPYHRLEIQFSDGVTRRSDIFKTAQFQSHYEVTIRQTDLVVASKFTLGLFTPLTYMILCGICLAGIIIIIVVVILLVRRSKKR